MIVCDEHRRPGLLKPFLCTESGVSGMFLPMFTLQTGVPAFRCEGGLHDRPKEKTP